MTTDDSIDLAEVSVLLAHTSKNDRDFVLRSLWLHEEIPTIQVQATFDDYGRKAALIIAGANARGIDTKTVEWFRSQEGVLATTYGARQIEWEEHLSETGKPAP